MLSAMLLCGLILLCLLAGAERATRPDGTVLLGILTSLMWLGALLLLYIASRFVGQGTFYVWIKGDKIYRRNKQKLDAMEREWLQMRNAPQDEIPQASVPKAEPVVVAGANADERQAAADRSAAQKEKKLQQALRYTWLVFMELGYTDDDIARLQASMKELILTEVVPATWAPFPKKEPIRQADVKNFCWNVGEYLGFPGLLRAQFAKAAFPAWFPNAELKTIEKTLRTPKAFCIPIANHLPTAIRALETRHQQN